LSNSCFKTLKPVTFATIYPALLIVNGVGCWNGVKFTLGPAWR
jgi:hypothetical protein